MKREEAIRGLKAGRTLCLDGAATDEERQMIQELQDEGLIDVTFAEGDQYGCYKIRWIKE